MKSVKPKSEGERLVAAYLRQRGYEYEYEPEVGGKNLDFAASTPAGRVALEVYEPGLRLPNSAGAFDSIEPVEGVFAQRKLKQIKAAKQARMPLVIVIGSANSDIPFGRFSIEGVMFGRPGVRLPVESPDPGGDAEWTFLGPGRIQPKLNRGVSALALVRRFNPTKWRLDAAWRAHGLTGREPARTTHALGEVIERMRTIEEELTDRGVYNRETALARLDLFHNPHAINPLDPVIGGPHDDQHGVLWLDNGRGAWGLIASGVLRKEVPDSAGEG